MVATRRLTKVEAEEAIELAAVRIPSYPRPSHPFSRGALPDLYSVGDLGKTAETDSFRLRWFFERLCAIQIIIGNAVPFYFKEHDGALRSLDAGCLGHLKQQPNVLIFGESNGVIVSVNVSQAVISAKMSRLQKFIQEMQVDV